MKRILADTLPDWLAEFARRLSRPLSAGDTSAWGVHAGCLRCLQLAITSFGKLAAPHATAALGAAWQVGVRGVHWRADERGRRRRFETGGGAVHALLCDAAAAVLVLQMYLTSLPLYCELVVHSEEGSAEGEVDEGAPTLETICSDDCALSFRA